MKTMEIIKSGNVANENEVLNSAGTCTEEPGDNCWLQLD